VAGLHLSGLRHGFALSVTTDDRSGEQASKLPQNQKPKNTNYRQLQITFYANKSGFYQKMTITYGVYPAVLSGLP